MTAARAAPAIEPSVRPAAPVNRGTPGVVEDGLTPPVPTEEELAAGEEAGTDAVGVAEDEAGLLAWGVEVAVAVGDAPAGGGRVTGWPAAAHSEETTEATASWSATLQAFWTQGVTSPISWVFVQWQAKSRRDGQPSEEIAVTMQFSAH